MSLLISALRRKTINAENAEPALREENWNNHFLIKIIEPHFGQGAVISSTTSAFLNSYS